MTGPGRYYSPKYHYPYYQAETVSVRKAVNGQWVITVLLDEHQYESMVYAGYSKKEAVALANRMYTIA